jgi:hypothetical protein
MPIREWIQHLPDGFEILVRLVNRHGEIEQFSVVLMHDGEDITRYDNAHGAPHRDVMGRKNAFVRKIWCANMTNAEAFEHAINDLSTNYQKYLAFYDAH